jgi:hypothetical protein
MLFTIVGDDFEKKSKKTKEIMAGLKIKKPDAVFAHYDFLDLDKEKLTQSIETIGGLFEEKNIFWFSNIFRDKKLKELFLKNLDKISASENAFILTEDFLTETEFKNLKEKSFATERFVLPKSEFDIFSISNSVQNKNIKKLWLDYNLALKSGLVAEQIYGNIFFAIKTLVLAEKFSQKDSGLKQFPYTKARSSLSKWEQGEPKQKMFQLISVYNNSRLEGLPLQQNLEKFILQLGSS